MSEVDYVPAPGAPVGTWNAWVAAAGDRDACRARFRHVPADKRRAVGQHVSDVLALRDRRRRQKLRGVA